MSCGPRLSVHHNMVMASSTIQLCPPPPLPFTSSFSLFPRLLSFNLTAHRNSASAIPLRATTTSINYTDASDVSTASSSTLRELCNRHLPEHVLTRMEEIGFIVPTEVQKQALPVLLSGRDCVLHAQTGSGKTLAYLLSALSVVNTNRSAVQAVIVVPTRELGMQVTKVARMLIPGYAKNPSEQKPCIIMALLDGGILTRHKSWIKAEPPTIIVATLGSLLLMLEKKVLKLEALKILVIDEVDFMFNSSKQVASLRKLLTSYTSIKDRQTILASASIPQHRHFLYDCIQQKWTKTDVVHVHVNSLHPIPSCLHHRYMICVKSERIKTLLSLLKADAPQSAIIFVSEQSEKSKQAGNAPSSTLVVDALKASPLGCSGVVLLEDDMHINKRTACLLDVRQGGYFLVATDIAARGIDLPETTHIYNFDLPKDAVNYLHRAGRTGRKPFSDSKCFVTNILTSEEQFVLQRFENELLFRCEELYL